MAQVANRSGSGASSPALGRSRKTVEMTPGSKPRRANWVGQAAIARSRIKPLKRRQPPRATVRLCRLQGGAVVGRCCGLIDQLVVHALGA